MRIEIKDGIAGGVATTAGFRTDYSSVISETDTVIGALERMKSYSYNMNGGLGVLQSAIGNVDTRLQAEKQKRTALQSTQQKCDAFLALVSQTDSSCAEMVMQNQDEFYRVNQWAAPSPFVSMSESWIKTAGKWIKNAAKLIRDNINHSVEVYTETDFKELSTKELREYYNRMVELMDNGELSWDDHTRLMAFMDYLSKTTIDNDMSNRAKARVELYNGLYERLHPGEAEAINTFFENAPDDGITSDDINNIKFIAYNSGQPAHDAFFDNIADCRVNSWTYQGARSHYGMDEGEAEPGIHVNINESKNSNDRYRVVFHELGHNIDDLMFYSENEQGTACLTNFLSIPEFGDAGLRATLYSELREKFRSGVVAVNDHLGAFKLNDESVDQVVDALMDGRKKYSLDPYERAVYENIQDGIESTETFKNPAVSDVTGGLTNNTTAGYGRDGDIFKSGSGHPRESIVKDATGKPVKVDGKVQKDYYWYKGNEATGKQEAEFFAHYMEYAMTGQEDGLDTLRSVYPGGCETIENMLKAGRLNFDNQDEDALAEWLHIVYPKETFDQKNV